MANRGPQPQMSLKSIARATMSILLLLPLLLAHRQPHFSRPKSSVLRRMPMLYGKRDPALASPFSAFQPTSFPEPAASVLSRTASSLSRFVSANTLLPDQFLNSQDRHRQHGRSGSSERRGNLKARSKQRFLTDDHSDDEQGFVKRSEGEVGRRPDFGIPSVLLIKLYDLVNKAGNNDDGDEEATTNVFGNDGGSPHFLDSEVWHRRYQSGADARVHKRVVHSKSSASPENRLRRRLQLLSTALGYDGDGAKHISRPPKEDGSDLILLDGGDSKGNVDGLYYDDLIDKFVFSDDSGNENSDEAILIGPLDPGI